jgi:hypothetical protein
VNTSTNARYSRPRRPPPGPLLLLAVAFCFAVVAANIPPRTQPAASAVLRQRDAVRAEAEALVSNARAALERMPPESSLENIRDARLRRAAQTAYRAVAELADGREAEAAPALYAKFARVYSTFEAEAARVGHATCALNCKAYDEDACRKGCKDSNGRSCGCKLITFGCVVAECLF